MNSKDAPGMGSLFLMGINLLLVVDILSKARNTLKDLYMKKYQTIHLLHQEDRPFNELFIKMQVIRTKTDSTQEVGESILAEQAFDFFPATKRVVIEGHAGCGKSTLGRFFCREQFQKTKFDVIVLVELLELLHTHPKSKAIGPHSICECLGLGSIGNDLLSHKERVLWIFDGYDEVESRVPTDRPAFNAFFKQLIENTIPWVDCCIITSRQERIQSLSNLRLRVEPWTDGEVIQYIKRFFPKNLTTTEWLI